MILSAVFSFALVAATCGHPHSKIAAPARKWCGIRDDVQRHLYLPDHVTKRSGEFRVNIPVKFHIITDGKVGRVSKASIDAQMKYMQEAFSGKAASSHHDSQPDSGFLFKESGIFFRNDGDWYRRCATEKSFDMFLMDELKLNASEAMNVVTCGEFAHGSDVAGFTLLPEPDMKTPIRRNAIFVKHSDIHGDQRDFHTLVHEAGHYFALEHTFHGGCGTSGDGVADTEPEKEVDSTIGCPSDKRNSCPGGSTDPIHNFMDYSECTWKFSPGQITRMQNAVMKYYRPLCGTTGCIEGGTGGEGAGGSQGGGDIDVGSQGDGGESGNWSQGDGGGTSEISGSGYDNEDGSYGDADPNTDGTQGKRGHTFENMLRTLLKLMKKEKK